MRRRPYRPERRVLVVVGKPPAGLLVERLVEPQPHPADPHQPACQVGEPERMDERRGIDRPQVERLQEAALVHPLVRRGAVVFDEVVADGIPDHLPEVAQRLARDHLLQLHEPVLPVMLDLLRGERVGLGKKLADRLRRRFVQPRLHVRRQHRL